MAHGGNLLPPRPGTLTRSLLWLVCFGKTRSLRFEILFCHCTGTTQQAFLRRQKYARCGYLVGLTELIAVFRTCQLPRQLPNELRFLTCFVGRLVQ